MAVERLDGRRVLVLGAGSAAGRAIAVAFAAAGARVAVAAATTDGEEVMAVRRTRRAVEAHGLPSPEYAFDTLLGQNVQVSTRQVAKEIGGLDVLVTAQDYPLTKPTERTSDAEWSRVLGLNLAGVFFACRAAAREITDGGVILNVVPRLPATSMVGAAAYAAARYGVIGLSRALALEYVARGLRVYPIGIGERAAGDAEELQPRLEAADLGVADEVGALALYLATAAAPPAAGRLIAVNAGPGG